MAQTTITSAGIKDDAIVNADIKSDAAIAGSKLADDSIDEAKLDILDAPAAGEFLGFTSNGMEWVNGNTTIADNSVTAAKTDISIVSGDIIAEVETDKATMEVEAVDEGKLAAILKPEGSENVYISRIRKGLSSDKIVNFWVVGDNLLKGAALNTVQIGNHLLNL